MGLRILVVEDDELIASWLVRGLREEGFTVELERDGPAGWSALQVGPWDLVLLDWWLPREDGITVLRRFREINRHTPVLILTARDAVADRVQGLDAGADDYLSKPFAFEELLARIRAVLRRHDDRSATTLAFDDVTLDLKSQQAERAGHVLELTAKEYSLLLYFLRRPNEVLSRTRIYETVWHDRYDGTSNTLEVHIMELRRKLEANGARLIHTLRGRGYLFGHPPG
jgi:two-component system, OmpR family, copper resistance phosphate regulon response regulator CusR